MVDYDLEINCYPCKANIVADALSRKNCATLAYQITQQKELLQDLDMMGIEVRNYQHNSILTSMEIQQTLINKIKKAQKDDQQIEAIFKTIRKRKKSDFQIKEDGVLWNRNRLCPR